MIDTAVPGGSPFSVSAAALIFVFAVLFTVNDPGVKLTVNNRVAAPLAVEQQTFVC
jgi:hypothetical protein